jgi:hypothetical protein
MTPIDWPASLPCFRFEPYQVAPRPGAIEFDVGMLTHRSRIYTQNNEVVSVEMILSSSQEQALRTFYKTTLSMGTQWFNVEIWRNSQQESVEALFFGAPPVFVPVSDTHVRATFALLTRDSGTGAAVNPDSVYELTASYAVNIDALDFKPSAEATVPGGVIVTVPALSTDRVVITKPSIAEDPELTWDAWSTWEADDANPPGTGNTWMNHFILSDEDDNTLVLFSAGFYPTVADALAGTQAEMPLEFTGHTAYQFWWADPFRNDNRNGLSLRVKVYSLVLP